MEDALQRLENVTLEESRMTGAETLKAVHGIGDKIGDDIQGIQDVLQAVHDKVGGVEGMLQGVTNMLQGVVDNKMQGIDDRVKDIRIGDQVINSARPFTYSYSSISLFVWLGVERTGQQTTSHIDIVDVEGLGGVSDRVADIEDVRSAITAKDIGSRAVVNDGAQVFS